MPARLKNIWENAIDSLWLLPSVLVGAALILSLLLVQIDVRLLQRQNPLIPWLFSGTPDAGRTILSVIAGSLITVISITLSLTILALQQAASQYSPRVLRHFTSDRGNQIVIGTYIATFVYALMVLRTVRSATEDGNTRFVPALSITFAIVLAIICLGLLIYFIHQVSQSLQVDVIVSRLRHDLVRQIDNLYLAGGTDPLAADMLLSAAGQRDRSCYIYSEQTGFVHVIDEEQLQQAPFGRNEWIWIRASVGDFVTHGGILAELDCCDEENDELGKHIRQAVIVSSVRSISQDPMFAIRQLVDIALKALSPGINDPTTAENALFHLGDALGRLAERNMPDNELAAANGQTRIIFSHPTWDDFVQAAFSQVRREAADDVHVTGTILQVLYDLALRIPPGRRSRAIQQQVAEIRYHIGENTFSPADAAALNRLVDEVEQALAAKLAPRHGNSL